MRSEKTFPLAVLAVVLAVFLWSGIAPKERFTWYLEVIPAFLTIAILLGTYRCFRFTNLLYALMGLHSILLLIGGHYTYAEVPLFNWLRDEYQLSRNHYDRVGHFVQGFVPAMIGRELLLRTSPLKSGKWLFVILVMSCLGVSAAYELIEWQVSVATSDGADAFLGTQGDIWDTEKDMLLAWIGAATALLLLSRVHDRALNRLKKEE